MGCGFGTKTNELLHLIDGPELALNRGDVGKSWQPCFVAEVLDLVGGSSAPKAEMLLPAF